MKKKVNDYHQGDSDGHIDAAHNPKQDRFFIPANEAVIHAVAVYGVIALDDDSPDEHA